MYKRAILNIPSNKKKKPNIDVGNNKNKLTFFWF